MFSNSDNGVGCYGARCCCRGNTDGGEGVVTAHVKSVQWCCMPRKCLSFAHVHARSVRAIGSPKKALVCEGRSYLHRPFHCALSCVRNVLLDGTPQKIGRFFLFLLVFLRIAIQSFPPRVCCKKAHQPATLALSVCALCETQFSQTHSLTRLCRRGVGMNDVFSFRSHGRIDQRWHAAQDNVPGILNPFGSIPVSNDGPLSREIGASLFR